MALFFPTLYRRRITDVTADDLQRLGVTGLLLDVDNTLTTHDNPDVTPQVLEWLRRRQDEGLRPVIVSNNRPERVAPFARQLGLPFQAKAAKPLSRGYRAAAAQLGLPLRQCVVIGDQIFTDILGANLAKMPSVLLEPIHPETEQKFIVFKRRLERLLLRGRQARRRKEQYGE